MKKIGSLLLVIGFLFVDFLFFHDMFKVGEQTTPPQYLAGVLSIPVVLIALRAFFEQSHSRNFAKEVVSHK